MASIRRLKKDVDYLVSELVIDCFSYVNLHTKAKKDQAFKIIEEAVALRNKVRDLANHPDGKENRGLVKKHYRETIEKLVKGIEDGYAALEKLTTE